MPDGTAVRSPDPAGPGAPRASGPGILCIVSKTAAFDRFMIGLFLSLTAVACYAVPRETVMRMLRLPMSPANPLYPAISGETATPDGQLTTGAVYSRSARHVTFTGHERLVGARTPKGAWA